VTDEEYNNILDRVKAWALSHHGDNWWDSWGEDAFHEAIVRHISSDRPLPQPSPVSYFIAATWRNFLFLSKGTRAEGVNYSDSSDLEGCFTEDDELKEDLSFPDVPGLTELALHEVQGISYRQIARHLDIPEHTVNNRIHRAKMYLRRHYECNPGSSPC